MGPSAADVSARVQTLIVRHHGGDAGAAARRIGIEPERLTELLSGDWGRFSLDALAAVVGRHPVSIGWLLGPPTAEAVRRTVPITATALEAEPCS
jgi:hypothetical protein